MILFFVCDLIHFSSSLSTPPLCFLISLSLFCLSLSLPPYPFVFSQVRSLRLLFLFYPLPMLQPSSTPMTTFLRRALSSSVLYPLHNPTTASLPPSPSPSPCPWTNVGISTGIATGSSVNREENARASTFFLSSCFSPFHLSRLHSGRNLTVLLCEFPFFFVRNTCRIVKKLIR